MTDVVAVLLPGVGSLTVLVTVALLPMLPVAVLLTKATTVIVTVLLTLRVAIVPVTLLPLLASVRPPAWLKLSTLKVVGTTSVIVTPVAALGPAFVTTIVYVIV